MLKLPEIITEIKERVFNVPTLLLSALCSHIRIEDYMKEMPTVPRGA